MHLRPAKSTECVDMKLCNPEKLLIQAKSFDTCGVINFVSQRLAY